jgi:tripartite-type tricarboxylate transporter receptor subunit TctC
MVFQAASGILPHIRSGSLRALAVATKERSPLTPEIPTFAEQGFPGVEVVEHIALQAPTGVPADILARMHALTKAAMEAPDTRERLSALAVVPTVGSTAEWPAYFAAENAKWRNMIQARNIKLQ